MKPHVTLLASLLACIVVGATAIAPAWAANPTGTGDAAAADASAAPDAADAADDDAGLPPEGIQPTTTPDNLGCMMHAIPTSDDSGGKGASGGSLVVLGAVAAVAMARKRATRRSSP